MTAHDDDLDLSLAGEHDLAPHLDQLAQAAEALQTWASDVASKLSREGAQAQPTHEELDEGRRLAQEVQEALELVERQARDATPDGG